MVTVLVVMSALWLTAGLAVLHDGHTARKSIDDILASDGCLPQEPVRCADYPRTREYIGA